MHPRSLSDIFSKRKRRASCLHGKKYVTCQSYVEVCKYFGRWLTEVWESAAITVRGKFSANGKILNSFL